MTILIENEVDAKFDFDYEALANEVTSYVLSKEGCKYEAEINLYLVDDDEIKEINSSQRNIDRKTDVLSFPNIDYETPSDMSHIKEGDPMYFDPENSNLILHRHHWLRNLKPRLNRTNPICLRYC